MDFEFSEDQELLRESVRRFLEENAPLTPYVREQADSDRGTSDALWKGLSELGLPGILVPEEFGGSGLGMLEMGVVLEEMGRLVHPGPVLTSSLFAVSVIRAGGALEDQKSLLPTLADGSRRASVALLEAGSGSAWRAPKTRARAQAAGWCITGEKIHVPDAAAADFFLVVASDPDGLGLFVVESDSAEVVVTPTPLVDPTRKEATVVFTDAPAIRLSGDAVEAAVQEALDLCLIGMAVDGVGCAGRALELSLAYAREREQFGVPVGSFQAVQHLLADMLQTLELGRAGAYYALWAAEEADGAERHRTATLCKATVSDAFAKLGADAIQVFAGVGFTWEYDVHFYYKRLLSLQHTHGGASEHLEELASILLDD